ncbi:MAG: response regulator transcription factor [Elusimicrobia bacterium]|nr:response regulator transcription factor [Elusimicrobiota bacterium]
MARILVIDDALVIAVLLKDTLSAHGYEVLLAHTADEGLKLVTPPFPDLIISDIDLPDVSGIDVCKMLRSRTETRHIPLVLITSRTQDQAAGFEAGADDFIMKPFKPAELVERVRAILRRAQRQAAAPQDAQAAAPAPNAPAPAAAAAPAAPAPVAAAPAAPPPAPASAGAPSAPKVRETAGAWLRLAAQALCEPRSVPVAAPDGRAAAIISLLLAAELLLATALSPGAPHPLFAALVASASWASAVGALVVACSIFGVTVAWGHGAYLVSLASLPLVLRYGGALAFSATTSLSPFLFAAGPAPLLDPGGFLAGRLDAFELWSLSLLGLFLLRQEGSGRPAAFAGSLAAYLAALCPAGILYLQRG